MVAEGAAVDAAVTESAWVAVGLEGEGVWKPLKRSMVGSSSGVVGWPRS